MSELKPCPFCNKAPRVLDDDTHGYCQVFCVCEPEPIVMKPVGQIAEAIAAWNRRASPALEEREEMAKAIKVAKHVLLAKAAHGPSAVTLAGALLSSPRAEDVRREALEEAARVADDVQESEREEKRFDKEGGDYDPYSYGAGFSDGSITTSVNIGTAIRALLSSTRAGSGLRA